ncbi:MAG: hypothetical protein MK212_19540 [Saprospiraceae bacterium]|nr:hypothetical protein [Saprospiraceae bacterium]
MLSKVQQSEYKSAQHLLSMYTVQLDDLLAEAPQYMAKRSYWMKVKQMRLYIKNLKHLIKIYELMHKQGGNTNVISAA